MSGDAYGYIRVHKNIIEQQIKKQNERGISYGFFRQQGDDGMSMDFDFLSTAEQSRQRADIPDQNGIIKCRIRDMRKIGLIVKPSLVKDDTNLKKDNPAHGLACGDIESVRLYLKDCSDTNWVIKIK